MLDKVQLIFLIGLIGLLIIVLELVRRKKLKEEYSLLWIFTIVVLLALSIWRDSLLKPIAHALGIVSPPNALFVIGSMFILAILLHFSVVISSFKRKQQELAQKFALLNLRLEQLEKVENPDEVGAVENNKER